MTKRRVANQLLIEKRLPVILNAATQLFGQRGFHAVSIQDVAEAAGVSVGMIYQYVDDKRDLLYRVIADVVVGYEDQVIALEASKATGLAALCELVLAIARVVESHKTAARLGYSEAKYLSRVQLEDIKTRERRLGAFFEARIDRCIELGQCAETDSHMLAYLLIVTIQSWAVSAWRIGPRITAVDYAAQTLRTILVGLVPPKRLQTEIDRAKVQAVEALVP